MIKEDEVGVETREVSQEVEVTVENVWQMRQDCKRTPMTRAYEKMHYYVYEHYPKDKELKELLRHLVTMINCDRLIAMKLKGTIQQMIRAASIGADRVLETERHEENVEKKWRGEEGRERAGWRDEDEERDRKKEEEQGDDDYDLDNEDEG